MTRKLVPPRAFTNRARRALVALLLLGALAAIAAGCGSDDEDGGGGQNGSSAALSEAQAVAKEAQKRPTKISVTKPIDKPIPTGKKITFISCGASACDLQGDIVAEGAKDLGWTSESISTDGSPQAIQSAFDSALRNGTDAVILNAAQRATLSKQFAAADKKGIVLSTCCTPDAVGGTLIYNTSTPEQNERIGEWLAAYVVSDSAGSANALYVDVSAFDILKSLGESFESSLKRFCPGCGFASIDIPLTLIGEDSANRIVSYLRSHTDVNYVVMSTSESVSVGLPAALKSAGLDDKVTLVGQGADESLYQYLAEGQVQALVPFDFYGIDYQMLDALARHFAGVPVEATQPPTIYLATKDTAPSTKDIVPMVEGYREQFLKLWGKG